MLIESQILKEMLKRRNDTLVTQDDFDLDLVNSVIDKLEEAYMKDMERDKYSIRLSSIWHSLGLFELWENEIFGEEIAAQLTLNGKVVDYTYDDIYTAIDSYIDCNFG